MKKILLLTMMLVACTMMQAQGPSLQLPKFFADGMVLQRDAKIPVWGKGTAGNQVAVSLNGKTAKTKVQADGTWKVYLPKMKAGGPYTMTVTQKTSLSNAVEKLETKVNNVLIGDVFLCSGQSNMELPIRRCMDVVGDMVKDYSNDQIRYLKFPHQFNFVRPNEDVH